MSCDFPFPVPIPVPHSTCSSFWAAFRVNETFSGRAHSHLDGRAAAPRTAAAHSLARHARRTAAAVPTRIQANPIRDGRITDAALRPRALGEAAIAVTCARVAGRIRGTVHARAGIRCDADAVARGGARSARATPAHALARHARRAIAGVPAALQAHPIPERWIPDAPLRRRALGKAAVAIVGAPVARRVRGPIAARTRIRCDADRHAHGRTRGSRTAAAHVLAGHARRTTAGVPAAIEANPISDGRITDAVLRRRALGKAAVAVVCARLARRVGRPVSARTCVRCDADRYAHRRTRGPRTAAAHVLASHAGRAIPGVSAALQARPLPDRRIADAVLRRCALGEVAAAPRTIRRRAAASDKDRSREEAGDGDATTCRSHKECHGHRGCNVRSFRLRPRIARRQRVGVSDCVAPRLERQAPFPELKTWHIRRRPASSPARWRAG